MDQDNRVIVLIDMDCFYCQVEEKLNPELRGKPIAVVQYNLWKGGGIIAVNYVARAMGVTRHMRGDEAKEKCPDIQLPSVPCLRGKADTTKYRDAGKDVAKVLQRFTTLLERASVDEAYLDITASVQERLKTLNTQTVNMEMLPNTYALGYESVNKFIDDVQKYRSDCIEFDYEHSGQLLIGAVIVSEIRAAVYEETGYRCSAGIAHNKTLAKLVCGMNKPNKQTILPKHSINILYKTLPLKKVKHLGGKFGDNVCRLLKINNMGEMQQFSEKELQAKFDEKNGTWLYNIARGIDLEPVQARFSPKSIGCCKQFRGKTALLDLDSLKKWLRDLGDEIEERLEKDALENNRTPKQIVVSFTVQFPDGRETSSSRSYNFMVDDDLGGQLFSSKSLELVMESLEGVKLKDGEDNRRLKAPIKFLGISVGKFEDNNDTKKTKTIMNYFSAGTSKETSVKTKIKQTENEEVLCNKKDTINKNEGKNVIFQKFFQVNNKVQESQLKENCLLKANNENKVPANNKPIIESTLDKQESFFAKFLNGGIKTDVKSENNLENAEKAKNETNYPITPVCDVVKHEDNDTDDSGSTIEMEINKSISLFQDDPNDITRVSNMRQLLRSSTIRTEDSTEILQPEPKKCETNVQQDKSPTLEYFDCSECGKIVPVAMFDTHADYHLALKLREEERQQVRKEIKERNNQRTITKNENVKRKSTESQRKATEDQSNKAETTSSLSNFFVKFDDTTPTETCKECGKKVLTEKLAEHLDFHEAQRLNRELNRKPASSTFDSNIIKRKRKTVSPVKKPKVPCKSIDSFFR